VAGTNITPEIAQAVGLNEPKGFLVTAVIPASPVSKAGMIGANQVVKIGGRQVPFGGDVILGIDGRAVKKIDDVFIYLERYKMMGNQVDLLVLRNGKLKDVRSH
jgi:serine protease Do